MYTCGRLILIFGLNFFFQKYTIHLKKPWPQSQCEARYRDFLCESNSADFLSYQSGSFVKGKVFNFITAAAAAAAKLLQSCPTLWDPIDGSPTGSPVPAILQARTLEWVAISFSNAWKWKLKWSHSVVSASPRPHGLQPTRLLHPWDFPGKSTGVGCQCLLPISSLKIT